MLAAVVTDSPSPIDTPDPTGSSDHGADPLPRTVIKHPNSAYLIVAFTALCVTAVIGIPMLAILYLIPILGAAYIARTATIVDDAGITARVIFGAQLLRWDDLIGLRVADKGDVYAVTNDSVQVRLPCVRGTRLKPLVAASAGRIPDLSADTRTPENW
jgi:Bacterial PH domain